MYYWENWKKKKVFVRNSGKFVLVVLKLINKRLVPTSILLGCLRWGEKKRKEDDV